MPPTAGARKRSKEVAVRLNDNRELLTLTNIRQLLKNEFAFDGYMTHGQEDVAMGKLDL